METNQKIAFRQLVASVLGLDISKVFNAQQNMPKQSKTYCTLRYYSYAQETPYEHVLTTTPGEQLTISRNTLICEIQMFAASGTDACAQLQKLINAFDRQTINDQMDAAGIAIVSAEQVQDISALLDDTVWETRASVDITIRFTNTVSDDVGYVDKVEITGKTSGSATTTPDINISEEA
ncbi:LIC_12616 family protein [Pectinatus frisingensis]|uniref:phage neck terminator protein n=1 Tax=Pectinatus frisingensis TaxID=865 RepID=UPI0018C709AA|nr:hypothetical protein [Pectinatus frisingensis]